MTLNDVDIVYHGRHQESEARGGGNVGARARAQGAMEIGVWGLWAKCRPHSFAAVIRSVHHKHVT